MSELYELYVAKMQKIADVQNSIAILNWDKEVNLPPKGAKYRSQQISTLAGMAHELFVDEDFGELLEKLVDSEGLDKVQANNIKLTYKDYTKQLKFSTDFVVRRSKVTSDTYHRWIKDREEGKYNLFKEGLRNMIEIKLEECERIGYEEHPYDALIDEFEPGTSTSELDVLFSDVREQLVTFVDELRDKEPVDSRFLKKHYPKEQQWEYGLKVLERMGYDFKAGRQDISPHPFTTNFSAEDVRITTRIDENDLGNMTWSCIHEGGHALYEQGLPADQYGLPSGTYVSLGIHESQSRLWENNVGRSLSFWKSRYAELQSIFPENLGGVSLKDFFRGINKVKPNLIRTESDELHYHFHILIRFEIEKALMEKSLDPKNLRDVWNDKYKEYMEVDVNDDKKGILQDIHWSHGSFGYFPTYSLGSFYAAQFFHQAKKDVPGLVNEIEKGNTAPLLSWLRTSVHQHGRLYTAEDLCEKITGETLNFKYFMDYARDKYVNQIN